MAEALYIPRFTAPPPVNPRVNFWTALDWDPYEERLNNGVHIVRDGKQAGVYIADGNDLIQVSRIPAVDPANLGNVVLRTLAAEGITADNRLPDELRFGTERELEAGRCWIGDGTTRYVISTTAVGMPTNFPFTVSGWFNSSSTTQNQTILGIVNSATFNQYYHVQYNGTAQRLLTYRRSSDGETTNQLGSVDVPLNTWTHVAVCFLSSTSYKYSINGSSWVLVTGLTAVGIPSADAYIAGQLRVSGGAAMYLTGKLFDCRWWNRELNQTEIDAVRVFGNVTSGLANHWWLADRCARTVVDSSGNGNRGIYNGWVVQQHYSGKDVPFSPANELGWSAAHTGTTIGSNPGVAMTGAGTSPPTISNGTFFGRTGSSITFPAAGGDGYAVSRAAGNAGGGTAILGKWYRLGCLLRLSRPLVGGEYLVYYWTGDGGLISVQIDANVLSYGQGELLPDGWIRLTSPETLITTSNWVVYPVLYKGFLSSDITAYVADHRCWEDFGHPVLPLSSNTANSLRGTALEYKGKCPARPKLIESNGLSLNGTNQFIPLGAGYWDTDGTEPMRIKYVYTPSTMVTCMPVCNTNGAGTKGWQCWNHSNGTLEFRLRANNPTDSLIVASTGLYSQVGRPIEVEWVYSGSKLASGVTLFVDGIQRAITTVQNDLTGSTSDVVNASGHIGVASWMGSHCHGIPSYLKVNIGSDEDEFTFACGSNCDAIFNTKKGTRHPISNAGNNWVTTNGIPWNLIRGFRMGPNLLRDSKSLNLGFGFNQTTRTEIGDMLSGAKILRIAKTTTGGSASWSMSGLPTLSPDTPMTFSLGLRATSSSDKASFGLYHYTNNWANSSVSWSKISGPGTITQGQGSLIQVTGLSQFEWTYVRVTATLASAGLWSAAMYPDIHTSTTLGAAVDTTEWQIEAGSSVSPFFLTNNDPGPVRIPAMADNRMVAANGLPVTHPAGMDGDWHNLAETKVDFSCGQPLAPLFQGVTPPTAWKAGDAATGLTSEKYSNKERAITLSR